ncbi:MAG: hypothetical protein AABX85_00300 [Nanoarchaeota archaeon]
MKENRIWTKKAIEVIDKRLKGKKLSQQDSNYLSRFVRPKLRDIMLINAPALLNRLEYNRKSLMIERKIKEIILKNVNNIDSIVICGSAIQTNYREYNDIDVIIATRKIIGKGNKKNIIGLVVSEAGKNNLNLDVQIYSKGSILEQYKNNPSLIYQLKDSKAIYGNINVNDKISLSNIDLKMKLDWSEDLDINCDADEIYLAIRNAMLVLLLMNRIIDNYQLKQNIYNLLGQNLLDKLRKNEASKIEKEIALNYLRTIIKYLNSELDKKKWEKIEIENH